MSPLRSEIVNAASIGHDEREAMLGLYCRYYEGFSPQQFYSDLDAKDDVILLREREGGAIMGFSTLKKLEHMIDGRRYRAVFSGDTIIESTYWGTSSLQIAFSRYMLRELARRPWQPLYWHLISKGYKTYLLLANNFGTFYPRCERPTPPAYQRLMHHFARESFGDAWRPEQGLLIFDGRHEHLKSHVANIHPELIAKNPHVRFFAEKNPHWQRGDELVCLGVFDWRVPVVVLRKALRKLVRRRAPAKKLSGSVR
jgi:hypothetical protein